LVNVAIWKMFSLKMAIWTRNIAFNADKFFITTDLHLITDHQQLRLAIYYG
jgi:hypothetical protein